jgi:hypothetical protein
MATVQFSGLSKVVETLADRDRITRRPDGLQVQVNDTTGDPAADSSPAVYRWVKRLDKWVLEWKSAKANLAFIAESRIISADTVTAAEAPGSGVVWDVVVTNTDGTEIVAEVDVNVEGRTIRLLPATPGQFDGLRLSYKYATGDIDANNGVSLVGNLNDLTTTKRDSLVTALNEVVNKVAAEANLREFDFNELKNQIAAISTGVNFKDTILVSTEDMRLRNGLPGGSSTQWEDINLSDLLPFADDDTPVYAESNIAEGSYVLSYLTGRNGEPIENQVPRLLKVVVRDEVKYLTLASYQPANNDFFVVQSDLSNSSNETEVASLFSVFGNRAIKICDFKWNVATGISLSTSFTVLTGNVLPGDTVQVALAKVVGNLAAEIDRATQADQTNAALIGDTKTIVDTVSAVVGTHTTAINNHQTAIEALQNVFLSPQVPQNKVAANYTLVLSDAGKHLLHPSVDTLSRIFTVPSNSVVAFPIGTAVTFINQNGAGVLSIAIASDIMRLAGSGSTGTRALAANGVATAVKIADSEWIISGTNLT